MRRHRVRVHWNKIYIALAAGVVMCAAVLAPVAMAQNPAPAQQGPQWKDRAEYDLEESIKKEQNPNTAITLLDQWKQKYPNSDYDMMRLKFYLVTYQKLKNAAKMMETSKAILAKDPDDMQALYWTTLLTVSMNDTSASALDFGDKCAKALLKNLDTVFGDSKKPPSTSEAEWRKERTNLEILAKTTIGWVAMQKKDNVAAEADFKELLKLEPNNGQMAYWLGTVILAQRVPEKQANGLYYLARASQYSGTGELPAATKKQISDYLENVYTQYHGSADGLSDILTRAKTDPNPPENFHIQSAAEVQAAKLEELRRNNPMIYLWREVIKAPLMKEDGMDYFNANLKDTVLPGNVQGVSKLRGRVVSENPPTRPTEVYLAISEGSNSPEVLLKLDGPMRLPAPIGSVIGFEGPVRSFTKTPRFMLVFEVNRDELVGWPKSAGAAN